MRKRTLLIASLLVLASAAAGHAVERERALVLTPPGVDWRQWERGIHELGARTLVGYPPGAFVVDADGAALTAMEQDGAIVHREAVPTELLGALGREARYAAGAWNRQWGPSPSAPVSPIGSVGPGVIDAIEPPDLAERRREFALQKSTPIGAGFYETSEFMLGTVAVGIVIPESDGTIDSNQEDWTTEKIDAVVGGIQEALTYWANFDSTFSVAFYCEIYDSIATGYEPIKHGGLWTSGQELWIADCMDSLGYATGDIFYDTRDFINGLRTSFGTDWAFTMFVVDSEVDADGRFTDFSYSYSYYGGPFLVMTYDNWTWGIENMNALAAHELGHQFYALDEYGSFPCSRIHGYLGTPNQNDGTPGGCMTNYLCLYRTQHVDAYEADSICHYSKGQVGWWDTDGDQIPDILDTHPETGLDAFPDTSVTPTPTFTGTATLAALPNLNPKGTGLDLTLATISGVEYRIDGATWNPATPTDGAFDSLSEDYTLTTGVLTEEPHVIEVRALSSVGNEDTTAAADTFDVLDVTAPGPATGLNTVALDTSTKLFWTTPDDFDFDHVTIRYRTDQFPVDSSDGILLGDFPNLPGSADSVEHTPVIPDTLYYYALFALDEVPLTSTAATVIGAPLEPAPPTSLFDPLPASLYQPTLPDLRWSASDAGEGDEIDAYWLQIDTDPAFSSPVIDMEITTGAPADTEWTVASALAEGTTHYVRLRAKDASSGTYGYYSEAFSFSTELPVDSLFWRDSGQSLWTNLLSSETLPDRTDARLEVGVRPADAAGLGGHAAIAIITADAGASWDSLPMAWDHADADTGFFRVTLGFGSEFVHHDSVSFRFEAWDPTTVATPLDDDGGYYFFGGANPLLSAHVPANQGGGVATMRDPLIGNILDEQYAFEVEAPTGEMSGATLRLSPAGMGEYTDFPTSFFKTKVGFVYYRVAIDTSFAEEDSLDYYLVSWGDALFDTTYLGGTDVVSNAYLTAAEAEAAPYRFKVGTLTSVAEGTGGSSLRLYQNTPNPFNPHTIVSFELGGAGGSPTRLAIYDPSGRLVRVLLDRVLPAGRHEAVWSGRDDAGRSVGSGVYLYELRSGGRRQVRSMTLLR